MAEEYEEKRNVVEFGKTPWDDLDRNALLREVQRYYSAAKSAQGALKRLMYKREQEPFWSDSMGTGGIALEKLRQCFATIEDYDEDSIYGAFFRYADDLLFDSDQYAIGSRWQYCKRCKNFWGGVSDQSLPVDTQCPQCHQEMEPLTWSHLHR